MIPPQGTNDVPVAVIATDWNMAINKTKRLIVAGQVRYSDVFHLPHRLEFCYFLVPDTTRKAEVGAPEFHIFEACPGHNEDALF